MDRPRILRRHGVSAKPKNVHAVHGGLNEPELYHETNISYNLV
jgi:hypothetical protein